MGYVKSIERYKKSLTEMVRLSILLQDTFLEFVDVQSELRL